MAKTYIKGNAVANATSYELNEKNGDGTYTPLETKNEINFELDALGLADGDHTLVVKAKADGYEDSDYSNEVVYTAESGTTYTGYDELVDYVRYGNVQTSTVDESADTVSISKDGTTGDLVISQANADGKYTVTFLNIPLTVGSEVVLKAANYAEGMAPNMMIGIDSEVSTFPVENTWKNAAGSAYIAASHMYIQPSSTTNKNGSYLQRSSGSFAGCSPALGCWTLTASAADYTAFSEFMIKVLSQGFAIYKNGELIYTVNSSGSNPYINNEKLPAYFMMSCAASAGYKVSIKSVKVA